MYGYIYKTTIPTSKGLYFYIGQHKSNIFDKNYYGSGIKLMKWVYAKTDGKIKSPYCMSSKVAKDLGLSIEILAKAESAEELNNLEEKFVKEGLLSEKCWNILEGGKCTITKGFLGHKHTDKTKDLLRKRFLGKIISKETREKISRANRGKPSPKGMLNKHHSLETLQKIRATKLRNGTLHKKLSKETIDKMKLAKQNISSETRRKMSEGQKRREPILHTADYKQHMSNLYKGEGNPCFGKICWNNGKINKFAMNCPGKEWKKGRLKKKKQSNKQVL